MFKSPEKSTFQRWPFAWALFSFAASVLVKSLLPSSRLGPSLNRPGTKCSKQYQGLFKTWYDPDMSYLPMKDPRNVHISSAASHQFVTTASLPCLEGDRFDTCWRIQLQLHLQWFFSIFLGRLSKCMKKTPQNDLPPKWLKCYRLGPVFLFSFSCLLLSRQIEPRTSEKVMPLRWKTNKAGSRTVRNSSKRTSWRQGCDDKGKGPEYRPRMVKCEHFKG